MKMNNEHQQKLLGKHKELDYLCRHPGDKVFVSDWYCSHPFAEKYLPRSTFGNVSERELSYYCFQNDTTEVHKEIISFHKNKDNIEYKKEEIYVGAGMTSLITAQILLFKTLGFNKIYYTKPLYYNIYYLANILDLELIPVCHIPLNKPGVELKLPDKKSCLIVCDPLWYMGNNIAEEYIEKISNWQRRTESYIYIDGAFQYMKWSVENEREQTSILDRELTFRSVCPTKALALHGIRFSYTLLPYAFQESLRYSYANSSGSSCIYSHKAAQRIMQVLNSEEGNGKLLEHIQRRYKHFLDIKLFKDNIGANCTYFVFVKLLDDASKYIVMDQDFFDTTNYPGYIRFNLLLPHNIPAK